jgi:hypothetical protein
VPVKPDEQYLTLFISPAKRAELQKDASAYGKKMREIAANVRNCMQATNRDDLPDACATPDMSRISPIRWPSLPPELSLVPNDECYASNQLKAVAPEWKTYGVTGYLFGDPSMYGQLYKIDNGRRVPIALEDPSMPLFNSAKGLIAIFDPSPTCKNYGPATKGAFGAFSTWFDGPLDRARTFEVHLVDRLERETVLRPTIP